MEFGNPIVGTEDLIRTAIKSPNYEPGIAGWIIRQDGTAEFQDLIARGDVTATGLDIDNSNFGGEDRGRLQIFFDDVNLNQHLEWLIGQQNIDDFITGGAPSGASQTSPAEIRHEVRGTEGPELVFESGRFNGQNEATLAIFGEAWDGSANSGISLNPGSGGIISLLTAVICEPLRHEHLETATDLVLATDGNAQVGDGLIPFTGTYPPSGVVTIHVYFRGSTSVDNAIMGMGFEVRDTNAAGTVRHAFDGNKRAEHRRPGVSQTGTADYTETVDGLPTSGVMFIRPIYIGSPAATATYLHRTMDIIPSP